MLRHMVAAGHDAYLIDWGSPGPQDGELSLGEHVTDRLLPLLATMPRPPILVGYCLGGSLAIAAAMLRSIAGVAAIAAPWKFDAFPEEDRQRLALLWREAKPLCERLGYVPMEVLQSGFWAIDPTRTIEKFAAFADRTEGSDEALAFLALEDWANAGPPLTFAAGRDIFEQFYAGNLPGSGQWTVSGINIVPEDLTCPSLSIGSMTDRIVPAQASPHLRERIDLSLGHVGMVVGGRARAALWDPLSAWIATHDGSALRRV